MVAATASSKLSFQFQRTGHRHEQHGALAGKGTGEELITWTDVGGKDMFEMLETEYSGLSSKAKDQAIQGQHQLPFLCWDGLGR